MGDYLEKLVMQYKNATGITNFDYNSLSCLKEFFSWLESRRKIGENYVQFLKDMKVSPFDETNAFEVDKGKFDAAFLHHNIGMITPYYDGLKDLTSGVVVPGVLMVLDRFPSVVLPKNFHGKVPKFKRLITENPYNEHLIYSWPKLSNEYGHDITVGIFGNINDKDVSKKREMLDNLKGQLFGNYVEGHTTFYDGYADFVATKKL